MIELAWTGLIILGIAWATQIISMTKGKKEIKLSFVGLQIIGIFLLILSDFIANNQLSIGGMLELLPFIGAIITIVLLIRK
jgi:hypothetical protein